MNSPKTRLMSKLTLRQQISLIFAVGIFCLAFASSVGITKVMQNLMYKQLLDDGKTLTQSFAIQSTLPLLFQSQDSASEAAQATLAFPSVSGITVLTPELKVLFSQGSDTSLAPLSNEGPDAEPNFSEDPSAWYFSQPVYAGQNQDLSPFDSVSPTAELVGYVQLRMSKQTLSTINREILTTNLLIAIGLSFFLILALLAITGRATKPLHYLAQKMNLAERGKTGVRAELKGPKDVIDMESAFNSMMEQLENRQDELRRARDSALATAKMKGEFATTVSHELRTPMNGVMGMLELLSTMDIDQEQKDYLEIAQSSGEILLQLIDDILDFSKVESGKLKIIKSAFDPHDMVHSIVELLTPQATAKNLVLDGKIDDTVNHSLIGDSGRIRQVLVNLVGNAIKFTAAGSVDVNVKLETNPAPKTIENKTHSQSNQHEQDSASDVSEKYATLRVSVTDTGIGIPEDFHNKIFEAFSQVDGSTTREFGGTGLGLAICHQLINLMGGEIGVKSLEGNGSTFWFTLPVQVEVEEELTREISASKFSNSRILVVSSVTERSHKLVNIVNSLDCFFRQASTATSALDYLDRATAQGKSYDFIILDFNGDRQSEVDVINLINESPKIGPITGVLLSRNSDIEIPENCLALTSELSSESLMACLKTLEENKSNISENVSQSIQPVATSEINSSETARILIVEDNKTNQIVTQNFLKKLGYRSDVADNGRVAIAKLEIEFFDLVLMDCNMPVMNGYEAAQLIRNKKSKFKDIPVIALSANNNSVDHDRCLKAGMNDCLPKPVSLENLANKLAQWLTKKTASTLSSEDASSAASTDSNGTTDFSGGYYGQPEKRSLLIESIHDSTLLSLHKQLGKSFETLIKTYLQDTPLHIAQLQRAVAQKDWHEIKGISHVVKGSSANIGAKRLLHLCQSIEDTCVTQEIEKAVEITYEVTSEFNEVEFLLRKFDSDLPFQKTRINQQEILIVENDPVDKRLLESNFAKDGYRVTHVESSLDVIEYCQNAMPDLILLSAISPHLDGIETCKEILAIEHENHPPIVIATAMENTNTVERAFEAGAEDVANKPFNFTVLRKRIARILSSGDAHRHIQQLSYYDNLTLLPNRIQFSEKGRFSLTNAEKRGHSLAVMFLDLDRFKYVNETLGHEAGDLLLRNFAQRLESCVRDADIVARLGGDEFAILLDDIKSVEGAKTVAEKILESLSGPFDFMQDQLNISTSIGVAVFPDSGKTIEDLMKQADTAMFEAKSRGGNAYAIYIKGMDNDVTQQFEIESEIQRALQQNEFVLFYQPQTELETNKIIGCEALIRWEHPIKGLLSPFHFIPAAEKAGLINDIGTWVINQACRQIRTWLDQDPGYATPVAVNVSGRELADNVLLDKVKNALAKYDVPPSLFKLEITEDTLVGGDELTTARLNDLQAIGVRLAIDDFGTGYSSLSYLKLFPIDTLKIDRSFVQDIPDKASSDAIITGIISLGQSLNLKIIAEGIETQEQKEFLREKGCDIMQGYLLSKPIPADEFEEWVLTHNSSVNHLLRNSSSGPAFSDNSSKQAWTKKH